MAISLLFKMWGSRATPSSLNEFARRDGGTGRAFVKIVAVVEAIYNANLENGPVRIRHRDFQPAGDSIRSPWAVSTPLRSMRPRSRVSHRTRRRYYPLAPINEPLP